MLSQNEGRMRIETQHKACYGFSLAWWAHWLTNISLSAEMLDHDLYYLFQKKGWMTETWYILNPVAILNWFGVPVKTVSKEPADFRPRKTDIVIGQWKADSISHFVAMYPDGCIAYDPWFSKEGGSKAVREGSLLSYRIFRR